MLRIKDKLVSFPTSVKTRKETQKKALSFKIRTVGISELHIAYLKSTTSSFAVFYCIKSALVQLQVRVTNLSQHELLICKKINFLFRVSLSVDCKINNLSFCKNTPLQNLAGKLPFRP